MKINNTYCILIVALNFLLFDKLLGQSIAHKQAGINILTNGGFESGKPIDFGSISGWQVLGNRGSMPVGFSRTKKGLIPSYIPKEGVRMALFSAGNNDFGGAVSQSLKTVPGATYTLKLKYGIVTEAPGREQVIKISIVNSDGAFILSQIESIKSTSKGTTWNEFAASFIAAGSNTRLTLEDFSEILPLKQSYNTDLLIDDVSVYDLKWVKKLTKFEQWMEINKTSGKISDDFDKDTLSNGTEYVIGTNPKIKTGSLYFPKTTLSFSDPDGDGKKNRYVVFNYRRSKISFEDTNVAVYVDWRESNKDQWKNVSTVKGVVVKYLKNKYPGNIDLVSVHIPRTITKSGNFMTRLRVVAK